MIRGLTHTQLKSLCSRHFQGKVCIGSHECRARKEIQEESTGEGRNGGRDGDDGRVSRPRTEYGGILPGAWDFVRHMSPLLRMPI